MQLFVRPDKMIKEITSSLSTPEQEESKGDTNSHLKMNDLGPEMEKYKNLPISYRTTRLS